MNGKYERYTNESPAFHAGWREKVKEGLCYGGRWFLKPEELLFHI